MSDTNNERHTLSEPTDPWGDEMHPRNVMKSVADAMEAARSSQLKEIAENMQKWRDGAHLREIATSIQAWRDNAQIQEVMANVLEWRDSAHIKDMATSIQYWRDNSQLKEIAASMQERRDNLLLEIARRTQATYRSNYKALAENILAWRDNTNMKEIAVAMQAWRDSSQLKNFAASIQSLGLTNESIIEELAARSRQSSDSSTRQEDSAKASSSLSVEEFYEAEVIPSPADNRALTAFPTWLLWLWLFLSTTGVGICNWETARTSLVDINARLPQTESPGAIRKFIHTHLAGKPGDYRLVRGENVRLRAAPGMKSEVIMTLPRYALVAALGKVDRTWLYVSYEHQGVWIDGYVSTKFLRKVGN